MLPYQDFCMKHPQQLQESYVRKGELPRSIDGQNTCRLPELKDDVLCLHVHWFEDGCTCRRVVSWRDEQTRGPLIWDSLRSIDSGELQQLIGILTGARKNEFNLELFLFAFICYRRGEGGGVINASRSHQLAKNNAILRNLYDWGWSKCSWTGAINLMLCDRNFYILQNFLA